MRFLPNILLSAVFSAVVIAESSEKPIGPATKEETKAEDVPETTIFNGVEVPPIPVLDGENFNTTIKDGYWFVKHHS
jgi:protein disulfide-isomerase